MRPRTEYEQVAELLRTGLNDCAIARATGIPRVTIRDWRRKGRPGRYRGEYKAGCPVCDSESLRESDYAYLLGLYLGDGYIVRVGRVWCLRVFQDARYPRLIAECAAAMNVVCGRRVSFVSYSGCVSIACYWNHWPCVFPQHGAGRKHMRPIVLVPWQREIVATYPAQLLRGLINSDGSRTRNKVAGKIYPRYEFSNRSDDIRSIFITACDSFGLSWTQPRKTVISIAKARDVAKLDLVIGPKS